MTDNSIDRRSLPLAIVIFASCGYFVDMYGLLLPMMLPMKSFEGFLITDPSVVNYHDTAILVKETLMKWQMGGILIGGFVWGILGDLRGRLYSMSTAMVFYILGSSLCGILLEFELNDNSFNLYKLGRFFTGIGLAGELGAATTIACEVLSLEKRAKGVAIITAFGFMGSLLAYYLTHEVIIGGIHISSSTQDTGLNVYIIGAIMGFFVWILRNFLYESFFYEQLLPAQKSWKNLFRFWGNRRTRVLYLSVLLIGLPIWYRIGILVSNIQAIAQQLGMSVEDAKNLMPDKVAFWMYVGVVLGNFACPILSDFLKSRKTATFIFMLISVFSVIWLLVGDKATTTVDWVFFKFFMMGIGTGYWGTFVMMSAEAVGTNVRCAVTSTTPNLIRATLIPMLFIIQNYATNQLLLYVNWMAVVCFGIAFLSWAAMQETYGNDLDFVETFDS